jgi:hypothetical protein
MTGSGLTVFTAPSTSMRRRPDGSVLLSSDIPLGAYPSTIATMFRSSAHAHPGRVLVAEREGMAGGALSPTRRRGRPPTRSARACWTAIPAGGR